MPGPACPNARPGQCPGCRAQTRGAQQHYAHHLCSVQSRQWEGWQLSVTPWSVIIKLGVCCKRVSQSEPSSAIETLPWGNYPPITPPSCVIIIMGHSHRLSWASAELGSRPARLTRPKLHQIWLEISAPSSLPTITRPLGCGLTPGGLRHIYIKCQCREKQGVWRAEMRCLLHCPPMSCISPWFPWCYEASWWSNDSDPTSLRKWFQAREEAEASQADENMIQRIKWSNFLFKTMITLNCSWQYISHPPGISRGGTPLTPRWNEM